MTTRGNVFKFQRAFVWRVTSGGIAVCQLDPLNLTPGAVSHAMEIHGPITATLPDVTYDRWVFHGGAQLEGTATGGASDITQGQIQASQLDTSLTNLLQGGNTDTTTLTNVKIAAPNSLNPNPREVGLMLVANIQSRLSANAGNKFLSVIYPRGTMRSKTPNLTQEAGTNPSPVTLTFDPQVATHFPTGVPFDANQGWEQDSEFHFWMISENPFGLTAFVQDASETEYTTEYLPVYSTVTGGKTNNWYTVNGAPTAPTSHSISTGLVTLAAAGTSGQVAASMYQTAYRPSP